MLDDCSPEVPTGCLHGLSDKAGGSISESNFRKGTGCGVDHGSPLCLLLLDLGWVTLRTMSLSHCGSEDSVVSAPRSYRVCRKSSVFLERPANESQCGNS